MHRCISLVFISTILFLHYIVQQTLITHARSPLWTQVCKTYSYEHLQRTESADHKIHEVITDTSLSRRTLPTTKSGVPLNSEINTGKYEDSCQVEHLNPGGQIPPWGTKPVDLWFVRSTYLFYISSSHHKPIEFRNKQLHMIKNHSMFFYYFIKKWITMLVLKLFSISYLGLWTIFCRPRSINIVHILPSSKVG